MLKRAASPTILEQISAKDSLASQYAEKMHRIVTVVSKNNVGTHFLCTEVRWDVLRVVLDICSSCQT